MALYSQTKENNKINCPFIQFGRVSICFSKNFKDFVTKVGKWTPIPVLFTHFQFVNNFCSIRLSTTFTSKFYRVFFLLSRTWSLDQTSKSQILFGFHSVNLDLLVPQTVAGQSPLVKLVCNEFSRQCNIVTVICLDYRQLCRLLLIPYQRKRLDVVAGNAHTDKYRCQTLSTLVLNAIKVNTSIMECLYYKKQ